MFREELPRLYEIRDLIKEPDSPCVYFQNFDDILKGPHIKNLYLDFEKELQGLDSASWEFLKKEAYPYLIKDNKTGRGWQHLFNILRNQTRAYNYLKKIGCSSVQFIPSSRKKGIKTPDLQGVLNSGKVLCEVKTINISDEEVQARIKEREEVVVRETKDKLEPGFLLKLKSVIEKAKEQLDAFDTNNEAIHRVYIIINFDDVLHKCESSYYQQIYGYLSINIVYGIAIVFHNQRNVSYIHNHEIRDNL